MKKLLDEALIQDSPANFAVRSQMSWWQSGQQKPPWQGGGAGRGQQSGFGNPGYSRILGELNEERRKNEALMAEKQSTEMKARGRGAGHVF